ncbi:MAG: hypothetical protein JSU74_09550 [Candidatus Zixiibacteriota bacterium]|nr:MAG: hypothetical protein JSU74_09550 [candidate division Zixibacteria bacterium]
MGRRLPLAVCFVFGLVMFLQYFSEHPVAINLNQTILDYWQIVFAFTLIVGIFTYFKNNVTQISRGSDRPFRLVGLAGFVSMPLLALIWGIKADTPFMWMFENVQAPMQSTVFALLAFFVASASFRGFRARSLPAAVLLLSALLMLLSRSNIGGFFSEGLPEIANWIRDYPSMAARRAILIGIGLGSLTTSLRVIIGIERTWLGGDK